MAMGFCPASLVRSRCWKDFFVFVLFLVSPLRFYIIAVKNRHIQRLYIHGELGEPQGEPCRSECRVAPSRLKIFLELGLEMLYLEKIVEDSGKRFCDETPSCFVNACMCLNGSGHFVNCQLEMMIGKLELHD